jgi:hypothetical protein
MVYVGNQGDLRDDVLTQVLNKYVRQSCEREAAEQKHNHAKDCVRIFHGDICAVARLGAFGRIEGFFMVQLFDFSFVLARIVHLPVPSENLSRRGKKIAKRVNRKANRFCSVHGVTS